MRPIKFRGLTVDTKKWVYGGFTQTPEATFIVDYSVIVQKAKDGYPTVYDVVEDDPETVGQFADRTDKSGTEIWEGDIIQDWQDHNFEKWVVMWWPEKAQFVLCNGSLNVEKAAKEEFDLKENDRVIGNVHENPEKLSPKRENK